MSESIPRDPRKNSKDRAVWISIDITPKGKKPRGAGFAPESKIKKGRKMKTIYQGKTKNLLEQDSRYFFYFKDDMTGTDGIFDTGGNQVAGSVEGAGLECLKVSTFFFDLLRERGIATHFISSQEDKGLMEIKKADIFGKGLEVITRIRAVGSFLRRYGNYVQEGENLNYYTEFTLKDDDRNDPLITEDGLILLNILTKEEYRTIRSLNIEITKIIEEFLKEKGLTLYDIKLEYGKTEDGQILLIDEVSGGNMRVYRGEDYISPMELSHYLF